MDHKPASDEQIAARLLLALEAPDEDTCEHVREQLPAFIEAERDGEDVDASPAYAALLRHLDHCADCAELYASIAEDLEALVGEAETLPQIHPKLSSFLPPVRESKDIVLRAIGGLKRLFEFELRFQRPVRSVSTLGGRPRLSLFSDWVHEGGGKPFVSISLSADKNAEVATLRVAVREASSQARWQVEVVAGDRVYSAITDENGETQFPGLPLADANDLTLRCAELLP